MKFLILAMAIAVVSWVAIRLNRRTQLVSHAAQTHAPRATRSGSGSGRHQRGFFRSGRGISRGKPAGKPAEPNKRAPSKGRAKGPLKKPWGW